MCCCSSSCHDVCPGWVIVDSHLAMPRNVSSDLPCPLSDWMSLASSSHSLNSFLSHYLCLSHSCPLSLRQRPWCFCFVDTFQPLFALTNGLTASMVLGYMPRVASFGTKMLCNCCVVDCCDDCCCEYFFSNGFSTLVFIRGYFSLKATERLSLRFLELYSQNRTQHCLNRRR